MCWLNFCFLDIFGRRIHFSEFSLLTGECFFVDVYAVFYTIIVLTSLNYMHLCCFKSRSFDLVVYTPSKMPYPNFLKLDGHLVSWILGLPNIFL